jgi:hypothetical protein
MKVSPAASSTSAELESAGARCSGGEFSMAARGVQLEELTPTMPYELKLFC